MSRTRHLLPVAFVVSIVSACGSPPGSGGTVVPASVSATAAVMATASPSTASALPSATPSSAASPRTVAFPDLPFIVGTPSGDLYFQLVDGKPTGPSIHACDKPVHDLVAWGRQATFFCDNSTGSALYLWDEATGRISLLDPLAITWPQAVLTGQGAMVYVTLGRYEESAPIPMSKLVSRDLRTGVVTTIDERYGVAFDLRLTDDGIAVWRPKNSLSFARSDADTGTWMLRGTTLTKLSQLRLVDGGKGRWVLESESTDPITGYMNGTFCCTYVVLRTSAEQRLTPADVPNEKALAMLDDGRVAVWRPEREEFDGAVVIYEGTKVQRIDRGPFTWYHVLRSGDWLIGQAPTTSQALRAYRISDGSFAGVPMAGVSGLAILGPKK